MTEAASEITEHHAGDTQRFARPGVVPPRARPPGWAAPIAGQPVHDTGTGHREGAGTEPEGDGVDAAAGRGSR